jgi:hypothetical protein
MQVLVLASGTKGATVNIQPENRVWEAEDTTANTAMA